MTTSSAAIREMIDIGKRLCERQFTAGSDGNISIRLDADSILVTPAGFSKGRLRNDDLVTVDGNGRRLDGKHQPSSEMAMHLAIYRDRPDINACVHAHPPCATAFALAGQKLPDDLLPEVVVFVGPVALTDYAPPGTEAVPSALKQFISDHNAFLLRNHGLLTVGRTAEEAYNRLESVEQYAAILLKARTFGSIRGIPKEDLQRLKKMLAEYEQVAPAELPGVTDAR